MEKEIDKKNLVLKEDESIGTVQIADDVVAMIASLAATEVDGVSAMAGNITNELMSKVGVKNLTSPPSAASCCAPAAVSATLPTAV